MTLAGSDSEEKCREALKQKDIYIVELEHYITSLQRTLSEKTDTNEYVSCTAVYDWLNRVTHGKLKIRELFSHLMGIVF